MSYPKTYRAIRRTAKPYPLSIEFSTETLPEKLGPTEIIIRIHAASLNYRDVAMLREGGYPLPVEDRGIEGSCCAAEVISIGDAVKKFALGDHVAPTVNLNFLTGEERDADAATITGVGITTWVSLDELKGVPKDATALLQGTGGVSIMALIVCLAAGIRPIITSSSDEKLERLKKINSAVQGVNYKTTPDIAAEVLRLTNGKGVDYVFNNAGLSSIPTDLQMLRKYGGSIALIGFLEGFNADWSPSLLMTLIAKAAKIKGLLAGSRADLEAVSKFLEEKKVSLQPLVDRVFAFDDAKAAFDYLESGNHVGKVVIKI
ncbi:hypothetical protein N0V90_007020 [Kalmusia sp. IMI 367209]|nr:hypothetical protein N0V90_007020 [Kalmusia sp. IMI 367209]